MLASRLAWVRTTPFGSPVLPEVNCRKAIACSSTAGKPAEAPLFSSAATVVTLVRVGICAASSRASGSTSGKEIRIRTSAVRRIPAWRLRWSSIWLARTGG